MRNPGSVATMPNNIVPLVATEAKRALYDYCWEAGHLCSYLKALAEDAAVRLRSLRRTPPEKEFRDALGELLRQKLDQMEDVLLEATMLRRIAHEVRQFFRCCLASNRTPDELIDGLRDDSDMREEVVNLLLSRIGPPAAEPERLFLHRMLSGDDDLRALLAAMSGGTGEGNTVGSEAKNERC